MSQEFETKPLWRPSAERAANSQVIVLIRPERRLIAEGMWLHRRCEESRPLAAVAAARKQPRAMQPHQLAREQTLAASWFTSPVNGIEPRRRRIELEARNCVSRDFHR